MVLSSGRSEGMADAAGTSGLACGRTPVPHHGRV